ncbi:MAG: c-type cytochrome [Solirubrobacteraceae bacterium]|nr:c-type cytochrome [Solirubrobacteraceae bacterium]
MTEEPVEPKQELAPPPDGKPGGAAAWIFGGWIGALVAVLVVAAWLVGKDEGRRQAENAAPTQVATAPPAKTTAKPEPAAPAGPGKQLFATKCGSCHTLKAAGTNGAVGPSLDDLQPDAALVEAAIQNGGAGSGAMPKGLAAGNDAKQIADFVAQAAGG